MKTSRPNAASFAFKFPFAGLLTAGALLLGAGCSGLTNANREESVSFTSTPANATVSIDGKSIGQTPFQAVLGKGYDIHLVIRKPGFAPADLFVHTQNGQLIPNPVDVKLRLEMLPEKPGANPQAELATCLDNLKKLVAIGTIAPEDAVEAEAQIRAFYK